MTSFRLLIQERIKYKTVATVYVIFIISTYVGNDKYLSVIHFLNVYQGNDTKQVLQIIPLENPGNNQRRLFLP